MSFTLDSIQVDPPCTGIADEPSELGHFIQLSIRLSTAPDRADSGLSEFCYGHVDWHVIGPNGVRENDNETFAAYSCVSDAERFPVGPIGPGTLLVGKFMLDSAHTSGIITFTPPSWETAGKWTF